MPVLPLVGPVTPHIIHPWSDISMMNELQGNGAGVPSGGAVWPAANDAIFVPFCIFDETVTIARVWWYNGTAVAGNVDVGVYDTNGTKLFSSGAIAQAGTSAPQSTDITDYVLGPGAYYMGISCSSASATIFRSAGVDVQMERLMGMFKMASAHVLPATATFAAVDAAYVPLFGLALNSVMT